MNRPVVIPEPGKLDQQRAILKLRVAVARLTLIHVDVVHAVAGLELEVLIRLVFGAPGLAECVHDGVVVGDRALEQVF